MRNYKRREIDVWFDKHSDELVDDVCRLIAVKSVREEAEPGMPYGPGPAAALASASEILTARGFLPFNFENRVVTADLNEHEPVLGMLAHLDTVAAGEGWSADPYKAVVRDGRIYGRGASDNKGPAVAAIYALAAATEIAPELKRGCRVLLGSAEETGHDDLVHYRKEYKMPSSVFTPDAEYPVVNAEKGRFVLTLTAGWPESAALPRIVSIQGGTTANAVPEYVEAVVEGMTLLQAEAYCASFSAETGAVFKAEEKDGAVLITSEGRAAHAMAPNEGLNAQTALLSMLYAMPIAQSEGFYSIKKLHELFPHGDITGKALGIEMSDNISSSLTLNFGVLSVGLTGLEANFDCRTPKCATCETLDNIVKDKLSGAGFNITDITKTPYHYTPEDTDFVRTLLRVYESYTGLKGECLSIGGQTYVHDIDGGVAFGCVFPGVDTRMHGADEFISIEELILSAKMFTQVIVEICS